MKNLQFWWRWAWKRPHNLTFFKKFKTKIFILNIFQKVLQKWTPHTLFTLFWYPTLHMHVKFWFFFILFVIGGSRGVRLSYWPKFYFTFPKFEFNTFSQNFSLIDFCWVYFTCPPPPRSSYYSAKTVELPTILWLFPYMSFPQSSILISCTWWNPSSNFPSWPRPVISVTGLKC